jgi:hypothetical protein
VVALLVLTPASAWAGIIGQSGVRGPFGITDTSTSPGATCIHGRHNPGNILGIDTRGPRVKARDTTSGVDHQWVGFRVLIERYGLDRTWHVWIDTSFATQYAADNAWTTFPDVPLREKGGFRTSDYRAVVSVVWYAPGSSTTIQGHLGWAVTHYSHSNSAGSITAVCTDTYPANHRL